MSEPMSKKERGEAIEQRRLRLGYKQAPFARATGVDRGAVIRAEQGTARVDTYNALETWLDREEGKMGASLEDGLVELIIEPDTVRVILRGPISDEDRRQVTELVRDVMDRGRTETSET